MVYFPSIDNFLEISSENSCQIAYSFLHDFFLALSQFFDFFYNHNWFGYNFSCISVLFNRILKLNCG
ncbi:unnamed protein product [Blepharisma stoltei]|uniref:Uncharacterized protein n=1 Tax=Blepharisma stoltei TaxID=1481888 RepID=A0AAU9K1Y8_9CILI|nr:unnamed protein product [Blepharisma stoltei]